MNRLCHLGQFGIDPNSLKERACMQYCTHREKKHLSIFVHFVDKYSSCRCVSGEITMLPVLGTVKLGSRDGKYHTPQVAPGKIPCSIVGCRDLRGGR